MKRIAAVCDTSRKGRMHWFRPPRAALLLVIREEVVGLANICGVAVMATDGFGIRKDEVKNSRHLSTADVPGGVRKESCNRAGQDIHGRGG
jgi:hypothetical protein